MCEGGGLRVGWGAQRSGFELFELTFEFGDAAEELGELVEGEDFAFGFTVGLGGVAEPFLAIGDVVHDTGLAADRGAMTDFDMTGEAGLAAESDVIADLSAAADTDLSDEDAMFAEGDVVADLDEVINFGAASDDGGSEGAAVDGGVGADLDIVLDLDLTDLRDFSVDTVIEDVAEAIGADDGAGVDTDAFAHLSAWVEHDAGVELGVGADGAVGPDMVGAMEDAAWAEAGLFADHAVGADVGGGVDGGGGSDECGGVDAGCWCRFREEEGQDLGEADAGVGDTDEGFWGRAVVLVDEDGGGGALAGAGEVSGVFGEGKVARPRFIGGGEAVEGELGIADDATLELLGDLLGEDGHGIRGRTGGWSGVGRFLNVVGFIEHDDPGFPAGGVVGVDEGEAHDGEGVAGLAESGGSAIECEAAGLGGSGDGVGFEARTVGHVTDEDSFEGMKADLFHEVGGDGEASLVVEAGVGDSGPMDFRLKDVDLHGGMLPRSGGDGLGNIRVLLGVGQLLI
jgi:hypothetical protein